MIDLHTHTKLSDGSLSPAELVAAAARIPLDALGITDHDTFAGFDQAVPHAVAVGLDLVCGVELSTTYEGQLVHLLGYFIHVAPGEDFRRWVAELQSRRHQRNRLLVQRLRSRGFEICLEEIYELGTPLPGRPHFAAILLKKGYVSSIQQAFDDYLGESGSCFVSHSAPSFREAVERILTAGGLPSLPHPSRMSSSWKCIEEYVTDMSTLGLRGLEVYHSDHSEAEVSFYMSLASSLKLAVTGGSDFHGEAKPAVALGTGVNGTLFVPTSLLDDLRRDTIQSSMAL